MPSASYLTCPCHFFLCPVPPIRSRSPSRTPTPLQAKKHVSAMPPTLSSQVCIPQPFVALKAASPGKLATRIQSLQFVDMRELLQDNTALMERLSALPHNLAGGPFLRQQVITLLLTWVGAFSTY